MHHRYILWLLLPLGLTAAPVKVAPTAAVAAELATETNSIGVKLIRIEPGSFRMGQDGPAADYNVKVHAAKFDDADGDEKPAHLVTLTAAFQIGATELTLSQYRQYQPEHEANQGADQDAVTNVSWHDAVNFCTWLSKKEGRTYRLPTEAEWEYACRAGTTSLFHTGNALPAGFHKWPSDTGLRDRFFPTGKLPEEYRPLNAQGDGLKVGQTPANPWGLLDMHGNISEWCADWYGPYEANAQTDPLGRISGDFRVIRGGSHSMQTRLLRSANRSGWLPHTRNEKTGFRVVCGEWPKGTLLPSAPPALNAQNVSQAAPKLQMPDPNVPFFAGPTPFVIIPPKSSGPLFSGHNHSPAITECPNGDLLAVWYSCVDEAGTELTNLASRLRFGRDAWEPASVFWEGPDINDHAPKLWWDGDRTLFHFARGLGENIVRTSTDNGATWSQAITTQPVGEWGNAPIRTRDGRLLISCDVTTTSLNVSRDGGRTWSFTPIIGDKSLRRRDGSSARHAGIHAPIVELNDGRLMTLGRLNTEEEQAKFGFKTPASYSSDGGITWTHEATPFPAISSVQRQVFMRLREGPLLFCSFTDLSANSKKPKGMDFPREGGTLHGAGLFAALSFDEGKTWSNRRLITPGGSPRTLNGIDRGQFTLSDTSAEPQGYLAATQTRDGRVQLISSKNHYVFNLAWLKALPASPTGR